MVPEPGWIILTSMLSFLDVLTGLIYDPCARKESRNIHSKGKSRRLPPTSTGGKRPEPYKPVHMLCPLQCRPHWKSDRGQGGSRPAPQQWCGNVAVSNKCVMCLCFAAHDFWVLRFITLLWESLPLPLQRKMATSRGKIRHLTVFWI